MSTTSPSALLVTIAVVLAAGCGPKRVAPPPRPTPPTLIALLPDPDSGITGRARVSNEFGSADLDAPRLTNWGEEWPTWRVLWTMIDHDLHHGGEIGVLRDLYRERNMTATHAPASRARA